MSYSNTGESFKPANIGSGKRMGDLLHHINGQNTFVKSPDKSLVIAGIHTIGSIMVPNRAKKQLIAAGLETLLDLQEKDPIGIVAKTVRSDIYDILQLAFEGKYKPKWSKE